MNLKQFREIESKGLIRTENRQIRNITIRGNGHWKTMDALIELEPLSNTPEWHNTLTFPLEELPHILGIFCCDDFPDYENSWNASDYIGKYVRLCWYMTPDEEMHELADEEYLYAIKHIIHDNSNSIYLVDPDKKRK